MSSYADKKKNQHSPRCAARPDCPRSAVTLRVVVGRPDWFCAEHAEVVDGKRKVGRR